MTADQIELMKRQIEVQLDEYEEALRAYARFVGAWRAKQERQQTEDNRAAAAAKSGSELTEPTDCAYTDDELRRLYPPKTIDNREDTP